MVNSLTNYEMNYLMGHDDNEPKHPQLYKKFGYIERPLNEAIELECSHNPTLTLGKLVKLLKDSQVISDSEVMELLGKDWKKQ